MTIAQDILKALFCVIFPGVQQVLHLVDLIFIFIFLFFASSRTEQQKVRKISIAFGSSLRWQKSLLPHLQVSS